MRRSRRGRAEAESDPAGPVHDRSEGESTAREPAQRPEGPRSDGPWDAAEMPGYDEDEQRADLGSLSVLAHEGVEVRLQADETSGDVLAVMLLSEDAAAELRAFAAPRNEDLWDDVRPRLVSEATRRGGQAAEIDGPYGPALRLQVPAQNAQGEQVTQSSMVMGIAGPRWMLRVSLFGRAATEYSPDAPLETALRSVVVNRGSGPMAPGESLPLTLPAGARRLSPDS